MASKPKKAKAGKARSAVHAPKELPKQDKKKEASRDNDPKPTSQEALIIQNGHLVEQLFSSRPWLEIAKPLLDESIAGVSGRFTNGRYWHGSLTTKWNEHTSLALAFYQKALMEFHNNLHDFITAKNNLIKGKKQEEEDKVAPIYNPFMEEADE
jgi:hypothetical protein